MIESSLAILATEIEKKASEMKILRMLVVLLGLVIICLGSWLLIKKDKPAERWPLFTVIAIALVVIVVAFRTSNGLDSLIDYLNS